MGYNRFGGNFQEFPEESFANELAQAIPKSSDRLSFNNTWYSSPLEDPEVYRMKDKSYALDTYSDLADILARVAEDHGRMKAALLKKGFLAESEDEESEEENVFAMD
ncbi:hypothetical protein N7447_004852 [Penicillium robsamsonii]|uniref:uncharacterized protein n=1 Tax=Penicillium robsamsonii TaxID=1792511 RepID=UPI002547152E|nr:uncharacterized protein N7447_004852 [Penicillium robsamsonii]KAJ5822512.1 hypothetical protein N7447_004852 [Penicillium robsamsonii]